MKKGNRVTRLIVIVALMFAVMSLAMAYASLTSIIEINSQTTYEGTSWLINLTDVSEPTIVGNAKEKAAPVVTSTSASFSVSLENDGDEISYDFTVKNKGVLDAALDGLPVISGIPEAYASYISCTLKHADGQAVTSSESLNQGNSTSYKITIKYSNPDDDELVTTNFNIVTTLPYVQK